MMRHILCSGRVSRRLKEMIFVAISSLKACHYCQDAHTAFCTNIGVPNEHIQSLIQNYTIEDGDPKDKAAIDFAIKLAKDSKSGSVDDINHLKSFGYDEEEIMELVAMSGMGVFYNHLADASGIVIDQKFKDILATKK